MNNEAIKNKISARKTMRGEYVSRINPLLGDSDPQNAKLLGLIEFNESEIDRLSRTLSVREEAAKWRAF